MTENELKDKIEECPKALNEYIVYFQKKYDETLSNPEIGGLKLNKDILMLNILKAPYACFYYFDERDMKVNLNFDYSQQIFNVSLNGEYVEKIENQTNRDDALREAVAYLFEEREKTL